MAIYIKTEEVENVILDPKSDDDLMIERFSKMPGVLEIRKASDEEIKRLWKPENVSQLGQTNASTIL